MFQTDLGSLFPIQIAERSSLLHINLQRVHYRLDFRRSFESSLRSFPKRDGSFAEHPLVIEFITDHLELQRLPVESCTGIAEAIKGAVFNICEKLVKNVPCFAFHARHPFPTNFRLHACPIWILSQRHLSQSRYGILSWCTGSQGNNHFYFFVSESLASCYVLFGPL